MHAHKYVYMQIEYIILYAVSMDPLNKPHFGTTLLPVTYSDFLFARNYKLPFNNKMGD